MITYTLSQYMYAKSYSVLMIWQKMKTWGPFIVIKIFENMNGLLLKPPYHKPYTEYHKMFILFIARQNCICKSLKLSCLSRLSLLTRIKSFRIDSGLIHKALLFIQFDWNTKLFRLFHLDIYISLLFLPIVQQRNTKSLHRCNIISYSCCRNSCDQDWKVAAL